MAGYVFSALVRVWSNGNGDDLELAGFGLHVHLVRILIDDGRARIDLGLEVPGCMMEVLDC